MFLEKAPLGILAKLIMIYRMNTGTPTRNYSNAYKKYRRFFQTDNEKDNK